MTYETASNSNTFFIDFDPQSNNKRKSKQFRSKGKNQIYLSRHDLLTVNPKTETQVYALDALKTKEAVVLHGSAGTGKTFLAMYQALSLLLDPVNDYDKIVIVRSIVPTRDIGYLPGTMEEKTEVYEAPYESIVTELTGHPTAYDKFKEQRRIEFVPTSFLRGTTFNHCIIIVDEFQNMTWQEFSTVMSRFGTGSRIIFCGDGKQNDLICKRNDISGFHSALKVLDKMPSVKLVEFQTDDIVRSGLVKEFIEATEKLGL